MISARDMLGHIRWAAVGTWGGKLASLAIFILLTRLLPVNAIGAVSLIAVYLSLLQLLGEAGLAEYLVQHRERNSLQEHSMFWLQLALSSLTAIGLCLAAPWVAASLSSDVPGTELVRVMSLTLPLAAAARVPDALMRKSLAFKQLAYRSLAGALCGGIVGIVCAFQGLGVWSLVIKQIVESLVALVAVMFGARWHPRLIFSIGVLHEPLQYGLKVFGARLISIVHARLDSLIVGWMLGTTALGYYSIASRVYQLISDLINSVSEAIAVPILAHAKHQSEELGRSFLRLVKGSSLLSMSTYAALCGMAPLIIDVAFGPAWAQSSAAQRWLALAGVVTGPLWFNGGVLLATGRASTWMLIVAGYVVVGAVLLPLGAVVAGISGVAAGVVARSLLLAPVSIRFALRAARLPISAYIRAWTPPAVVSLIVGLSGWLSSQAALALGLPAAESLAIGAGIALLCFVLASASAAPAVWLRLRELGGVART